MFYFDKKIYYIDYYEKGERISNAGFVSLTFKDEECLVHIGIRNLPKMDCHNCRWFGLVQNEQVFLEEFRIEKGQGDFVKCYRRTRLGKTEVDFSTLEGFYFSLGKRRWASCFFENPVVRAAEYIRTENFQKQDKKSVPMKNDEPDNDPSYDQTAETKIWQEGNAESGRTVEERSEGTTEAESAMHRTTWEELIETHQIVHPFDCQGDYISINPITLKMLAPEYRKLANNSFLLHGFYNYRHIILGYYQDDKREGYYIGVPGTYDEREQMVAEMFGFEGYEPAGGVGYYMRRVEF